MVDVATADDTPYSFEKKDRIKEERRAAGMGLEWPMGQIRWRTGLLFLLFFILLNSFGDKEGRQRSLERIQKRLQIF
jgi:hypothetical protein